VTTTTSGNNGPIVSSGGGGGGGGGTYVAPTIATPIATSIVASPSITTTVATQSTLPTAPALVPVVYGTPKPLFPKPSFVFTGKTLVKGLKNSLDIKNLQTFLAKDPTIYPEGIVNGNFGALTEKAIQRFQIKYGIIVNKKQMTRAYGYGIIGPRTRIKMMQVFNSN
jgi:peptidoglycan hydrolase-like protein with peptidoglycan-binding domain